MPSPWGWHGIMANPWVALSNCLKFLLIVFFPLHVHLPCNAGIAHCILSVMYRDHWLVAYTDFCTGVHNFFIHSGFPTSLESEPQLSELMNEVAAKIPNKWRDVGLQLGVTHSELEVFGSASSPDTNSRFTSVFSAWQKHMIVPYTWKSLIQALKAPSVGEIALAEKLKNRLTGSILPT